jgi:thioredoxin 1
MKKLLAAVLALWAVGTAWALDPVPFSDQAFGAAQAAGKPILVHVIAPWCTTCARQNPILLQLEHSPQFQGMVVFNVDFDHQKDLLKRFDVHMQSTLIVFSGKTEKGRATGITDPEQIKALLLKASA